MNIQRAHQDRTKKDHLGICCFRLLICACKRDATKMTRPHSQICCRRPERKKRDQCFVGSVRDVRAVMSAHPWPIGEPGARVCSPSDPVFRLLRRRQRPCFGGCLGRGMCVWIAPSRSESLPFKFSSPRAYVPSLPWAYASPSLPLISPSLLPGHISISKLAPPRRNHRSPHLAFPLLEQLCCFSLTC